MTDEQGTPPPDAGTEPSAGQAGHDDRCDPVRDRIERALDDARDEIEAFVAEARKNLEGVEERARDEVRRMRQRLADFLDDAPPRSTDGTEPPEEG